MCVIVSHEAGKVPTLQVLEACYEGNSDGIGVAYKPKSGLIRFARGISFDEMLRISKKIAKERLPYIIHFRFATIGAPGVARLCHPFPMSKELHELKKLQGETETVLAHNGTWRDMDSVFPKQLVKELIAEQGWSDSALLSWALGKGRTVELDQSGYGNRISMLSAKAGFGINGSGLRIWGRGWIKDLDIYYSNSTWRGFTRRSTYYPSGYRSSGYDSSASVGNGPAYCQLKSCNHLLTQHRWVVPDSRKPEGMTGVEMRHGCSVHGCDCISSRESCKCGDLVLLGGSKQYLDTEGKFGKKGKLHTPDRCWTRKELARLDREAKEKANKAVNESPDPCQLPPPKDSASLPKCACGQYKTTGEIELGTGDFHSESKCQIKGTWLYADCGCQKPWAEDWKHGKRACSLLPKKLKCACGKPNLPGQHMLTRCDDGRVVTRSGWTGKTMTYPASGYSHTYSPPAKVFGPKGEFKDKGKNEGYCLNCGEETFSSRDIKGKRTPLCYKVDCRDAYPETCPVCDLDLLNSGPSSWYGNDKYCGEEKCRAELQARDAVREEARKQAEEERKAAEEKEYGRFETPSGGILNRRDKTGVTVITSGVTIRRRADAEREKDEAASKKARLLRIEREVAKQFDCEMCKIVYPNLAPWAAEELGDNGYWICVASKCRSEEKRQKEQHKDILEREQMILAAIQAEDAKDRDKALEDYEFSGGWYM